MIPSSAELTYFLQVAESQNLSRAAERLGISQPTLTLAVRRLEDAFGVPLLLRSKSGVRLTKAGEQFQGRARLLLSEWEEVRNEVLKNEAEIRGRYIIGCHPSVALYSLPHFLPKLLEENPDLEVKLVHDISRRITEDVISFKLDFGLVVNPWKHPDLVIRPLCTDETLVWVSNPPTPLQDPTSGQAVLICNPELSQVQAIVKQLGKQGISFRRIVSTPNLELIADLVAHGAGVGIIPGRVVGREKVRLRLFSPDAPKFRDTISLIYRRDAQGSKASRLLSKQIERLFPKQA